MSDVRVRRHTDGRVAIHARNKYAFCWFSTGGVKCQWLTDEQVAGEGWSELLVTELPKPDGRHFGSNGLGLDCISPQWNLSDGRECVAFPDGVLIADDVGEAFSMAGGIGFDEVRSDGLKMSAAVAACERYRAERERS